MREKNTFKSRGLLHRSVSKSILYFTLCIALLSICAGSCMLPPFDEKLSLATITADKLTLEASVGPVLIEKHNDLDEILFIPEKGGILENGFVAKLGPSNIEVVYISPSTMGDEISVEFHGGNAINRSEVNDFNYRLLAVKDMNHIALWRSHYQPDPNFFLYQDDGTSLIYPTGIDYDMETELAINQVFSMSLYPDSGVTDRTFFLATTGTDLNVDEYSLDSTSFVLSANINAGVTTPTGALDYGYYSYYPTEGESFHSVYNGSNYTNYTWSTADPNAVEIAGFTRRIDRVLTSGELYCLEGNRAYIHDQAGNELYSFPLGSLHLAREEYDALISGFRLIFVLGYGRQIPHDHRRAYTFEVYSVPTVNLSTLQ